MAVIGREIVVTEVPKAKRASKESWTSLVEEFAAQIQVLNREQEYKICVMWLGGDATGLVQKNLHNMNFIRAMGRVIESSRNNEKNYEDKNVDEIGEMLGNRIIEKYGEEAIAGLFLLSEIGTVSDEQSKQVCEAVQVMYEELLTLDQADVASFALQMFADLNQQ